MMRAHVKGSNAQDNQIEAVQQRGEGTHFLPRGILLKLTVLFFMAHPGSAATFADTKSFLLSRYPNRDVIPSSLLQQQYHRRRQQQRCHNTQSPLLFIHAAPSPLAARPPTAPASSPSKGFSRGQACPVVIGSFVSELESDYLRRKIVKPMPQQQGGQLQGRGSSSLAAPKQQQQQQLQSRGAGDAVGLLKKSAATLVDAYDGVLSFVGSRIVTTEMTLSKALTSVVSAAATSSPHEGAQQQQQQQHRHQKQQQQQQQPHLLRVPSGAGELSYASSSSSSLSSSKAASSAAFPSKQLPSSAKGYDLVGFMDLDPFEKSRRYFKRNTSLTKLLL